MVYRTRFHSGGESPNAGGVDPLWVLWEAHGMPTPAGVAFDHEGSCARCGTSGAHARVKAVVSDKFTGWDAYTDAEDPLWCVACTWGHTDSALRTRPWVVGGGRAVALDSEALAEELTRPVPENVAVIVPVARQKHLLGFAEWGRVTTDDRVLQWKSEEVHCFDRLVSLRSSGFPEKALFEPVPRFERLARLGPGHMVSVVKAWERLSGWRRDPAYLHVALVAARGVVGSKAAA